MPDTRSESIGAAPRLLELNPDASRKTPEHMRPAPGNLPHPSLNHIPELDGLRGVAILMVIINHFWRGAEGGGAAERGLYTFILNGWVGVDLFFVLSGFLITGILIDAKGKDHYFRNFYARRVLRIFPLYYAFLFAWFIVVPRVLSLAPEGPFRSGSDTQIWFWTYTSNFLSLFKGVTLPNGLNHFWSLAIEEQFYLVWPAVVLFAASRTLRKICIAMMITGFAFRLWLMSTDYPATAAYVLTPARMDTLAAGAWLAISLRDASLRRTIEKLAPKILIGASALLVAINLPTLQMTGSEPAMQTTGFPLLALIASAILVMALDARRAHSRLRRVLRTSTLRFFGKYSYGMYVVHLPVVVVFEALGFTIARIASGNGTRIPAAIVFTLSALAATTFIAFVSWHLYEKHFLKLKTRFR